MKIIPKIEIAIELLHEAISNQSNGKYVPAIVLSGAAQQILRDLVFAKKLQPAIVGLAMEQSTTRKPLHDLLVDIYNKLKHADKEQNTVEVTSLEADILIKIAAIDLMILDAKSEDKVKTILKYASNIN